MDVCLLRAPGGTVDCWVPGADRRRGKAVAVVVLLLLETGYYHARGVGPCNWAQWPAGEPVRDEHFFPEASPGFRQALAAWMRSLPTPETP